VLIFLLVARLDKNEMRFLKENRESSKNEIDKLEEIESEKIQ